MTIPGLSFFYAGLVRKKNVLSVLMHRFACLFDDRRVGGYWLFRGIFTDNENGFRRIEQCLCLRPHAGFGQWQFLILHFHFSDDLFHHTPALMVGAFVDGLSSPPCLVHRPVGCDRLSAGLPFGGRKTVFLERWVRWIWLEGIVVHITAGLGALVACIVLGPRKGYPNAQMMPHNLPMTVAGTGMLWVGWFGFNGGSAVAANGDAATAIVVTQISAATAALTWMVVEWIKNGKPTVLGIVTGSIAGLAAITPASGVVGPQGALIIGLASGFVRYASRPSRRNSATMIRWMSSVFTVGRHYRHAVAGVPRRERHIGWARDYEREPSSPYNLRRRSGHTLVLLGSSLVVNAMVGLRVDEQDETSGLDISAHGDMVTTINPKLRNI